MPDPAELPVDPDAATLGHRAPHLSLRLLAVVALGGAAGTGVRYAAGLVLAPAGGWPWATLAVNLSGALLLGWLLADLARRGPDVGRRRLLRLLVGTGFCGGLTTYSTLAVEVDLLLADQVGRGVAYGLVTLVLGFTASWLGMLAGSRRVVP